MVFGSLPFGPHALAFNETCGRLSRWGTVPQRWASWWHMVGSSLRLLDWTLPSNPSQPGPASQEWRPDRGKSPVLPILHSPLRSLWLGRLICCLLWVNKQKGTVPDLTGCQQRPSVGRIYNELAGKRTRLIVWVWSLDTLVCSHLKQVVRPFCSADSGALALPARAEVALRLTPYPSLVCYRAWSACDSYADKKKKKRRSWRWGEQWRRSCPILAQDEK